MTAPGAPLLTLSVVSHGHAALVRRMLGQLAARVPSGTDVVITQNIPEPGLDPLPDLPLAVRLIVNPRPLGFGENHNRALAASTARLVCVLNPDLDFEANPFPRLVELMDDPRMGVIAPRLSEADGSIADSGRRFPTMVEIAAKAMLRAPSRTMHSNAAIDYPDWVSGAFMLMERQLFQSTGGFDERFRLYYEDVDLCARIRAAGREVALCNEVTVHHAGQRASRRDLGHLRHHLASFLRYCLKYPGLAAGLRPARAHGRAVAG